MLTKYKSYLETLKGLSKAFWLAIVLLILFFEQTQYIGILIIPFLFFANIFIFLRKQILKNRIKKMEKYEEERIEHFLKKLHDTNKKE